MSAVQLIGAAVLLMVGTFGWMTYWLFYAIEHRWHGAAAFMVCGAPIFAVALAAVVFG